MARHRWVIGSLAVAGLAALTGGAIVGRDAWFHLRPMSWSDEPARLARHLGIVRGHHVADIGAGTGALAVELAHLVGPGGVTFASEMSADKRASIAARAAAQGVGWIQVFEGRAHETALPDACCDAVVMRMVAHHIADFSGFAVDLHRVVKPGGRLGVIDFPPGAIPHLGRDHGSRADALSAALVQAGFRPVERDDHWGGRTYLLVFSRP
jgi:ubiquinone/menaquinone biosynthesis C-methylase UbiE